MFSRLSRAQVPEAALGGQSWEWLPQRQNQGTSAACWFSAEVQEMGFLTPLI